MIMHNSTFIPFFAGGDGTTHHLPTVGFLNNKIVYSRYVIFGTTYNTQDFTFDYSVNQSGQSVPHTWQVEVLGKAGTDSDKGDYYYCGLLNDTQDVTTYQSPRTILEQFTSTQYQTCKVRDILWVITFGDLGTFDVIHVYMKNNSYANSCDFTYMIPFADALGNNLIDMFSNAPITEVKKFGDFLQALDSSSLITLNSVFNNTKLTTLDFRPFTRWYNVINLNNVVVNSSTLENIYFSESDADNSNYVNIGFNNLTKITSLDLAKIRCKKVNTLNLSGNSLLATITGLSNIRIKTNATQGRILNGDLALVSDPDISSWVGEDGVSKPTITVDMGTSLWQNCGKSIPANSRTWEIDTRGWSFQLSSLTYQDKSNAVGFSVNSLGNSDGYGVKIAGIHFLPYSTNTWVILGLTFSVNRFSDTTLDIDAMVGASYELIINKSVLYEAFKDNTNLTTVKLGKAKVIDYGGEIQSYVLVRTFDGATNLSSIDLRVQHFNVYRNSYNTTTQQYETSLAPFNVGLATAWVDSTQINNLIDDLVITQSEQYRVNNLKLIIQFNAAQWAIIQARPNWSSDEVAISNNGWELQSPISVADTWTNINMSEMIDL